MSERLAGERILMRVFLGESDKAAAGPFGGRPLWEALLLDFRERGLAGATVLRAIAGYGASARRRTLLSEYLSLDLPIIVEVVDTEENINRVLPDLDQMIEGGLITLERVNVIIYRGAK